MFFDFYVGLTKLRCGTTNPSLMVSLILCDLSYDITAGRTSDEFKPLLFSDQLFKELMCYTFSDLDMPGTPGPSSVNELLGSLLSNIATGQSASSPIGSLLSSIGQPQSSGSLLSTSPLPPSISTEVAHPPISPLLLGAGRLLLQNWQPILQVRSRLVIISTPVSS